MKVRVLNLYENHVIPDKGLQSGHGESFLIQSDELSLLFDVGWKGKRLINNLKILGINPDLIKKIVFSHGHMDHTHSLLTFLKARTSERRIEIIAHPSIKKPKTAKRKFLKFFTVRMPSKFVGFPKIPSKYEKNLIYTLSKDPTKISSNISTTGEIYNRSEKDGTSDSLLLKSNNKWIRDPLVDDLSLVLQSKDGLVLICGCCHAGLLNTCAHVSQMYHKKIHTIVGGTHMWNFSKQEVEYVAEVLKNTYDTPFLYLNHCTGKKTLDELKRQLGSEVVKPCHVGTEMFFDC